MPNRIEGREIGVMSWSAFVFVTEQFVAAVINLDDGIGELLGESFVDGRVDGGAYISRESFVVLFVCAGTH